MLQSKNRIMLKKAEVEYIMSNDGYLSACARSCLLCLRSSICNPLKGINTCCTSGCVSNKLQQNTLSKQRSQFLLPLLSQLPIQTNINIKRMRYSTLGMTLKPCNVVLQCCFAMLYKITRLKYR